LNTENFVDRYSVKTPETVVAMPRQTVGLMLTNERMTEAACEQLKARTLSSSGWIMRERIDCGSKGARARTGS